MENEQDKPSLSAIEKAKILIDKQKQERLSVEEIAKSEEDARLANLYDEYIYLQEVLAKMEQNFSEKTNEAYSLSVEKNNIDSARKQAVDLLKSNRDTKDIFEDVEGEAMEAHHEKRREVFGAVFGDVQYDRRKNKVRTKQKKEQLFMASSERDKLKITIDNMKKSPEWPKLIEKKKTEALQANKKYDDFYRMNSENISLAKDLIKVDAYTKQHRENIESLKSILNSELVELLNYINNIFIDAEHDENYILKVFGDTDFIIHKDFILKTIKDIDFKKYKDLVPKSIEDINFSVYSYDSSNLTLSQFDYSSELYKTLYGDLDKVQQEIRQKEEEIRQARGIFSGKGGMKKDKEKLELKEKFMRKMLDSLNFHVREFDNRIFPLSPDLKIYQSDDEYRNKLGYIVSRYVQDISSGIYELERSDKTFPDFQRTTNITDLFKWADGISIPEYTKELYKKSEELKSLRDEKYSEYVKLVGPEEANRLRW